MAMADCVYRKLEEVDFYSMYKQVSTSKTG